MPTPVKKRPVKKKTSGTKKPSRKGIIKLEDLAPAGIKACIYGNSGTGKTRLMGTFGKAGPLLHMVCSGNGMNEALSIRGLPNIEVCEIKEPDDLPYYVEQAQSRGFKTISLDHVTEFGGMVLARIIGLKRLPEQLSWGLATQQQYGQQSLQAKEYLKEFLDFDGNCLILGQERDYSKKKEEEEENEFSEELEDIPFVSVATTPSVAGWIAPACDYVIHTFKRDQYKETVKKVNGKTKTLRERTGRREYCAHVGPNKVYNTKFRVPIGVELPDVIVDPSYEKLKPYFI